MVFVFNFKKQFMAAVQSGAKHQTIRANRADGKRPARGDTVKLYTGLRTSHTQLIRQAVCTACRAVRIDTEERLLIIDGERLDQAATLAFAQADGFATRDDFFAFFRETYATTLFEGFCVEWADSL